MQMQGNNLHGCRVLVTGASGFIGGALCRALTAIGAEVHGSTRRAVSAPGDADKEATRWWNCDLTDARQVEALVRDVSPCVVFHMSAAVTGSREIGAVLPTLRDNLLSTVHLLLAASEVGLDRLVLAGSLEANFDAATGAPRSPYAASKAAAAAYAHMFGALYQARCVDLRIGMAYGPGQRDSRKLVPYVIEEVRRGRSPQLTSGSRHADWTYIDDVVAALIAAATRPEAVGQSIEIGTGRTSSVREVVEHIVALIDPAVRPDFGALENRPLELEQPADPEPARRLLGWAPTVVIEEGLRRTVAAELARFQPAE